MLESVNLKEALQNERDRELGEASMDRWLQEVFQTLDEQRRSIQSRLEQEHFETPQALQPSLLDTQRIFHINQIERIAIRYRLRFLSSTRFKGTIPAEAISQIRQLEQQHDTVLNGFKILAPLELFTVEKADDPLLFYPLGDEHYYLIHQWGNDVSPYRAMKYWALQRVGNLTLVIVALAAIFTLTCYPFFFKGQDSWGYALVLFLFFFKGFLGWALYAGVSTGINFSKYNWQSRYDKIS